MNKRRILMIPGPNEPYPEILETLPRLVYPHYSNEWEEIYIDTCNKLKKIFQTNNDVLIFPGSGASAIGWLVSNIVEKGDKIINIKNGFFGELLERKIKICGGEVINVETEFGKSIKPEELEGKVLKNKDAKAIFVVQNETSSGVLNPIKEISKIAEENDMPFIVDAISGFGGIELKMDQWHIDACIGYASKCLGSIAMLSPIAFNERILEISKRNTRVQPIIPKLQAWKVPTWYDDAIGGISATTPVAMPTLNILALRKATELALKEGLENRFRRHCIAAKAVREGIKSMGLQILPKDEDASPTLTAVEVPDGMETKIRNFMIDKFNIMIGGSLGTYGKGKLLRIGHMGLTASPEFVIPTIYALEQVLLELGFDIDEGAGVTSALEIFKKNPNEWIKSLLLHFQLE